MFTDVEGSTALRTSLGDGEADKLFRQHDEIISAEIEANRGQDLQAALGDGFLAVFVSTRRAIACAVGIQQTIERFNRERAGAPMKVRIGLNTGEVAWQNGQPSGEAIHAASRVCGAADGGDVFVSDVTRQLAGTIPDVTFSDRGEHTLKGFPQPWKLWSLAWRGLAPDSPEAVFVGREHEVAELRKQLLSALDGKGGLVLIGGEPGVGKTTLTKQLIKEAEARGAVALFGRCYESEGAVPYSPFVEFIEQSLTHGSGRVASRRYGRGCSGDGTHGARASSLLPGHPRAAGSPPGAATPLLLQRRQLVHRLAQPRGCPWFWCWTTFTGRTNQRFY